MARASRSKKQPAFDPNELDDLILSPAVGTGVGSHLLSPPDPVTGNSPDVSPVATSGETTVDRSAPAVQDMPIVDMHSLSAVDAICLPTVDMCSPPAESPGDRPTPGPESDVPGVSVLSTVDITDVPAVDSMRMATVDTSYAAAPSLAPENLSTVAMSARPGPIWITRKGDLIPHGRVKPIRLAQDVINTGEQAVYDALWNAPQTEPEDGDCRIVQAGYDYLARRTRLARKTVQRIIDKLIDKDFIVIHRPADIYRRTPTVYRVFGYKAVLERHARKGRTHVARVGPGFSYVQPFSAIPDEDHT